MKSVKRYNNLKGWACSLALCGCALLVGVVMDFIDALNENNPCNGCKVRMKSYHCPRCEVTLAKKAEADRARLSELRMHEAYYRANFLVLVTVRTDLCNEVKAVAEFSSVKDALRESVESAIYQSTCWCDEDDPPEGTYNISERIADKLTKECLSTEFFEKGKVSEDFSGMTITAKVDLIRHFKPDPA